MVEQRKVFKTRLCVLYQRGRCSRQSCNFAHGDVELRRFRGRQDSGGSDLRDTMDTRYSPKRRYSPPREARGRHTVRGQKNSQYTSPSRSLEKESKRRKRQHFDDQNDPSGSLRISNEREDEAIDATSVLANQLKIVQSELDMVEQHRSELEVCLEERSQEVVSLTSKIKELEGQLYKEKEECKRLSSKVQKFAKAHSHHSKIQDQLKRSQIRLNKLGKQLSLDIHGIDPNEEDLSINIVSDAEIPDFPVTLQNAQLNDASPSRKKLGFHKESANKSKQVATSTREHLTATTRPKRLSRWNTDPSQSNLMKDNEPMINGIGSPRVLAKEGKHDRRKNASSKTLTGEKSKSLKSGTVVPSTSMAAHADDTEIDIELEGEIENPSRRNGEESAYEGRSSPFPLPLPPPPPLAPRNLSRYNEDNEILDIVHGVD